MELMLKAVSRDLRVVLAMLSDGIDVRGCKEILAMCGIDVKGCQ